jgi:hypothetical protein
MFSSTCKTNSSLLDQIAQKKKKNNSDKKVNNLSLTLSWRYWFAAFNIPSYKIKFTYNNLKKEKKWIEVEMSIFHEHRCKYKEFCLNVLITRAILRLDFVYPDEIYNFGSVKRRLSISVLGNWSIFFFTQPDIGVWPHF